MLETKIKTTPALVALMFCGFLNLFVIFCIAIAQFFKVLRLELGRPVLSNITRLELIQVGLFLLVFVLGNLIIKFTDATSQDASPPAASYLSVLSRFRVFVMILCVLMIFTT